MAQVERVEEELDRRVCGARTLAGEPVLGRPISAVERARAWARRHVRLVAAACLLVVSLIFGVGYTFEVWAFQRTEQQYEDERDRSYEFMIEHFDEVDPEWEAPVDEGLPRAGTPEGVDRERSEAEPPSRD